MSEILISVALILAFSFIVYLVNKIGRTRICPFCAGVSATWLLLTALLLSGLLPASYFLLPVAILMGGTVVGVVYQGEKKFNWPLRFKLVALIVGFPLAYFLLTSMGWPTFIAEIVGLAILTYFFFLSPETSQEKTNSKEVKELERKMEECC